jgi:hypothetical protein
MSLNALRLWGIAAGALLIAGALALSFTAPAPQALAQPAQAEPVRAEPLAFLVRFQGQGPIASAQRAAQRGRTAEGQRAIEQQLRRQASLSGLCFDRFTVGAAEVVLRTCTAIVVSERASVQQSWLTRLQGMRGVAYVDANAVASQGRAG